MKKKITILLTTLLLLTSCSNLQPNNIKAIDELRDAIKESETYGASTIKATTINELKKIVNLYSMNTKWFKDKELNNIIYGKINDTKKYEITSLCSKNNCATFKIHKKDYIFEDYSFEKSEKNNNKIFITNDKTDDEIKLIKSNYDITIDENGTATFTETRVVNINKGTEGVNPLSGLEDSKIKVLSASMDGKEYLIIDNWNRNATLEEKAYKASIYKPNEYENDIVFGISEYGEHTYKITYQIKDLVLKLKDSDAFYWQFAVPGNTVVYNNTTIKISIPNKFTDNIDYGIYGKDDTIDKIKDNSLYITTNGPLSLEQYLIVLIKFQKNTFKTNNKIDKKFNQVYN